MSKFSYKALKEIQECHERADDAIEELENELSKLIKPINRIMVKEIFKNQRR